MQERRWAGMPALVLCAVAFGVSYYLFSRGVKLANSTAAGADFCSTVFQTSCDGTLLSEYSNFLGMSFAAWGAVYYLALFVLVLFSGLLRHIMHRQALSAAILLNLGGLVISGYLTWLLLSNKVPFCPLCFFTHVLNLLLFPTLLLFRGGTLGSVFGDAAKGIDFVFAGRAQSSPENAARALALLCTVLVGLVGYEWFALRAAPQTAIAPITSVPVTEGTLLQNLMAAYFDADPVDIPAGPSDPREGPADAPLQLVVFSDFECPSCKSNANLLARLVQAFGDKISIVYKNYPLSSECNPNIPSNPHPNACNAALGGIAAHMQGKFVPYHHLVYGAPGAPTAQYVEQSAQRIGLDMGKWNADKISEAARAALQADIDLAAKLRVTGTPALYLNGRFLASPISPHVGVIAQQLLTGTTPQTVSN